MIEEGRSLEEIRRFWDINDVMRANELLDVKADAKWLESKVK